MNKRQKITALIDVLVEAGLEREKVEKLMNKVVKMARSKHSSVAGILATFANPGGHSDSIEYHLHLAMQNVGARIARLH